MCVVTTRAIYTHQSCDLCAPVRLAVCVGANVRVGVHAKTWTDTFPLKETDLDLDRKRERKMERKRKESEKGREGKE